MSGEKSAPISAFEKFESDKEIREIMETQKNSDLGKGFYNLEDN